MISARRFFSCLSDDVRLASMLMLLREEALCVCELVAALDDSQSKVSRHLAQLRHCGLVEDERRGQWVFYRLHPELPAWAVRVLEQAAMAEEHSLQLMLRRLDSMANRPQPLVDRAR